MIPVQGPCKPVPIKTHIVSRTLPLVTSMPGRVESMEMASNELWAALKLVSVDDLKRLKPTPEFVPLVEALIDVRLLMGGGE